MTGRARSRFRAAGGARLTARARAVAAIQAAGRRDPIFGRATDSGIHFKDRQGLIPWVPGFDLEQQILLSIPLTSLPPGVTPWRLGANVWNDAAATAFGESQVLGGGRYRIFSSAGAVSGVQNPVGTIDAKKAYICTFFVESVSVPGVGIGFMDFGTIAAATTGWKTAFLPPGTANVNTGPFIKRNSLATDIVVSRMTVQEVIYDWSWLGANLVTNGDFSGGMTGWASGSSFTSTGAVVSGELQVTATTNFGRQVQAFPTVAGKTYRATVTYRRVSGTSYVYAAIGVNSEGDTFVFPTHASATAVTNSIVFAATGSLTRIACSCNLAGDVGAFDNIVVQEMPGYPMVAPAAGGVRPSGRYNLLQRTRDISHSIWTKDAGGTGSAPTATKDYAAAPDGTMTACRVQFNRGAGTTVSDYSRFFQFIGGTEERKATVYLKSNTAQNYTLQLAAGSNNATVVASQSWTAVTLTGVSSTNFTLRLVGSIGTDATADVLVWDTDLRPSIYTGSAYPSYQRVGDGTAGVFDYDATGFPVWIRAAATNAGLHSVGLVGMSATDAVRQGIVATITSASQQMIAELSPSLSLNNGSVYLLVRGVGTDVQFGSRGTSFSTANASAAAIPGVVAASCSAKISTDTATIALNGGSPASSPTDQGTGNFGAHRYHCFGRSRDSGPSLDFTGLSATVGAHLVDANTIDAATFEALIREDGLSVGHQF